MDDQRFDAWTRALANGWPRRRTLKVLAGAALVAGAPPIGAPRSAAKPKHGKKKGKKKGKGQPDACAQGAGSTCTKIPCRYNVNCPLDFRCGASGFCVFGCDTSHDCEFGTCGKGGGY